MAIRAQRAGLPVASTTAAGQHQELAVAQGMDLGLRGDFRGFGRFGRGVCVERERDDVLGFVQGNGVADVVFEQACLPAVGVIGPAFLVECGLHERVQRLAVSGESQAFEALVIVSSCLRVCGDDRPVEIIDRRGISAEAYAPVAMRDIRRGRHNRLQHPSLRREPVDIRPVFVGDPERAIAIECQSFGVDGDASPTRAGAAESIACESCGGEDREPGELQASCGIGVEAGGGVAVRAGEEDGVEVLELEVGRGRVGDCSGRGRGKGDEDFLDAVLVVQCTLGIPMGVC